jgi:tRNA A37 threonylcarbamoyladenosine modification protein TsaB
LFVISANLLQTTNKNTISILDARSSKYYTCTYNDKVVKENITLKSMQEIQKLADKNKHEIVKDYDGVDIFNNLFQHINNFKKVNVDDLKPLYIKPAV